jgi:hypothetical protein
MPANNGSVAAGHTHRAVQAEAMADRLTADGDLELAGSFRHLAKRWRHFAGAAKNIEATA